MRNHHLVCGGDFLTNLNFILHGHALLLGAYPVNMTDN